MRLRDKAIAMVAIMSVTVLAVPVGATSDPVPGLPVYLSLGDSWAYGEGATDPGSGGYVPQFAGVLRTELDCIPAESGEAVDGCKHLQLINLARPATDTLPGVETMAVRDEQFPDAIPMLEARNYDNNPRNDVDVVTLQVGGNDVYEPILTACIKGFDLGCQFTFFIEMAQYEADLNEVVGELRRASGSDAQIILGTYDNPVPYCYLGQVPGAEELGDVVLEGTPDGSLSGLHDVIRRVANTHGADIAEVFGRLGAGDFVGGPDCRHPSESGYDKITEAFAAVIDQ